jgi:diacylglycerol kinase family enzyme
MKIAPDAKLDDGSLDVVIAGDMHAVRLLLNSHRLYAGTHLSMDRMAHRKARKVRARPVDPQKEILLEVDGETPGRLPATMELLPKSLRVRC